VLRGGCAHGQGWEVVPWFGCSHAAQAERAVGVIRFFLYIRFFLNAPLDLLLDVLTLSRSLALHFTVVASL